MSDKISGELFEIVTIDRRTFLRIAGGGLVALSGLGLVGCGGGGAGSSGGPSGLSMVSGSLQLPKGYSAKVGQLSVTNMFGSSPISTALTFNKEAIGKYPSLAYVLDPKGEVAAYGFIDPTTKFNTIGALSSAVALIYFASGFYSFPAENRTQLLSLIAQESATTTLSNVIAQRMVVNPFAFGQADPEISAATLAAFRAINTKFAAKSSQEPPAQAQAQQPSGLESIDPSGAQSGFAINQLPAQTGFRGTNFRQRECIIYVYEVATDNTPLPGGVKLIGSPIKVPPTSKLLIFGALSQVYSGTSTAFVPIDAPDVALGLEQGTKETTYEVVVVGGGGQLIPLIGKPYPAFWSDPKYAIEKADWGIAARALFLKTCLVDIYIGFALEALGVNAAVASAVDAAADKILEIKDPAWQNAMEKFFSLDFSGAVTGAVAAMYNDNAIFVEVFQALEPIISGVGAAVGNLTLQQLASASWKTLMSKIFSLFFFENVVCLGGSALGVGFALKSSDVGDLWTVKIEQTSLQLNPLTTTIPAGATAIFTAKLPGGYVPPPNTTVVYDWTQTGGSLSILSDGNGHSGQSSLETTGTSVRLVTTKSQATDVFVSVSAYVKRPVGTKTLIASAGPATCHVTPTAPVILFGSLTYGFHTDTAANGDVSNGWVIYIKVPIAPGAAAATVVLSNFTDPTGYFHSPYTLSGSYDGTRWRWSGGDDITADGRDAGTIGANGYLFFGLTGGGGAGPGNPGDIAAEMNQRFGGMKITGTYTF